MSRPHGHVVVDTDWPRRSGSCDKCGFPWNFDRLQPQFRWAGTALVNTGYLVCPPCMDEPAPFERVFILPPDPPPVYNSRMTNYPADMEDWETWEDGTKLVEEDGTTTHTIEGDISTTTGSI